MPQIWNFQTSGQLVFGVDSAQQIGPRVAALGISRILIVTDKSLITAGHVDRVRRSLEEAGISATVFDEGEAEPSIETTLAAIEQTRRDNPDAIVGLGGGSNMDVAKLTAVVHAHGGHPRDYFGFDKVPGPVLPIICVPTTAGTGSEVSHSGVLTDSENQVKVSTLSNHLRPTLAIVDPRLTVTCPPQVTADSGIDALTHAIEAYTAIDAGNMQVPAGEVSPYSGRHELGDCLAEKAIQLVGQNLRSAVKDGGNIQARTGMALAATLAGMAFSNCGVALVHALEYPIGGALHCSHGAGNGLLLPYVMRFNLPERRAALAKVAALLGQDTADLDEQQAAELAIKAVEQLKQDIGIPRRLRELRAQQSQLSEFADKAFAIKRLLRVNPRAATKADLLQILESAL